LGRNSREGLDDVGPLINTMKERYDMWLVKKYGLPWFYWNLMLKGRT
jgi:sulfide:quinone oxidoreductase